MAGYGGGAEVDLIYSVAATAAEVTRGDDSDLITVKCNY
jgi:hypothetical protein